MIVNDFNIFWTAFSPDKTYPILIVDANTVLTCTITLQCFKSVSRRRTEEAQRLSRVQLGQVPDDDIFERSETTRIATFI